MSSNSSRSSGQTYPPGPRLTSFDSESGKLQNSQVALTSPFLLRMFDACGADGKSNRQVCMVLRGKIISSVVRLLMWLRANIIICRTFHAFFTKSNHPDLRS